MILNKNWYKLLLFKKIRITVINFITKYRKCNRIVYIPYLVSIRQWLVSSTPITFCYNHAAAKWLTSIVAIVIINWDKVFPYFLLERHRNVLWYFQKCVFWFRNFQSQRSEESFKSCSIVFLDITWMTTDE